MTLSQVTRIGDNQISGGIVDKVASAASKLMSQIFSKA